MEIFTDKGSFPFATPSISDSFCCILLQRSRKVAPTRKNESNNFVLQSKHTTDTVRCLKYYLSTLPDH